MCHHTSFRRADAWRIQGSSGLYSTRRQFWACFTSKGELKGFVFNLKTLCLCSDYVATLVHNKLVRPEVVLPLQLCSSLAVLGHSRRKATLWSRGSREVNVPRPVGQKNVTETCETDQVARRQQTPGGVRSRRTSADTFSHTRPRRKTHGYGSTRGGGHDVRCVFSKHSQSCGNFETRFVLRLPANGRWIGEISLGKISKCFQSILASRPLNP